MICSSTRKFSLVDMSMALQPEFSRGDIDLQLYIQNGGQSWIEINLLLLDVIQNFDCIRGKGMY